jgi:hypothetical protein
MKKIMLFLILLSGLSVIAGGGNGGAGGAGGQPGQPGQSGGRSCGGKGGNGGSADQKKSFAGGCYGGGGRPSVNQPGGLSAGLGGSSGGAGGLYPTVNNSLKNFQLYELHYALIALNYYEHKEAQLIIEEILFRKSPQELNCQNADDETPLMIAVQGGDFKNAQALLDTGVVNLELKDNKGRTAFYLAYLELRKKQLEPSPESLKNAQAILDLLFEHGAENSCRSKECSDMHDYMKAASRITHNQKPA